MSEREAYAKKLKAQLEEWNAELDRLKAETQKADADTRNKYEPKVEELYRKSGEALKNVTKIQEASEDTWTELIEGAEKTWNSLKEVFTKTKSEFKRGYREGMNGANNGQ
jgi:hypothetical protein